MSEPVRPASQRKRDTLARLVNDRDCWVGTGDTEGNPTLVPLSFLWNGSTILIATAEKNPTARNIVQTGRARVALGNTYDVTLIDCSTESLTRDEVTEERGRTYADKCEWNPWPLSGYQFYQLTPRWIETWRELNEHPDRFLMRDGQWLV